MMFVCPEMDGCIFDFKLKEKEKTFMLIILRCLVRVSAQVRVRVRALARRCIDVSSSRRRKGEQREKFEAKRFA
jgi:hypothetical protein